MNYETKILLNRLIEAVDSPDLLSISITIISILISGILSFLLYRLTKKLGEQQNTLQQNNLRIQMHQKYFDIYDALHDDWRTIEHMHNLFQSTLEGKRAYTTFYDKVQKTLDFAKQILPPQDYENLLSFYQNYSFLKNNMSNLYSYIERLDSEHRGILKDKLRTEGFVPFLTKLYEMVDYDDVDNYCNSVKKLITLKNNGFIEKIRSYSDLSDIIKI